MTQLFIGLLAALMIGLLSRFKIRDIAFNAVADAPDPALAVGLPNGLSSTAVAARKAAMIAAGTPAIYAEKFAIDAEQQQAWHDNPKLREEGQANPQTPAEREAAAITAAQKLEKSKLQTPSEKTLEQRQAIADEAEKAAAALAGMSVEDLRAHAAERNITLTADMKKADIIAAIREAK
jgi:hypothetical protein